MILFINIYKTRKNFKYFSNVLIIIKYIFECLEKGKKKKFEISKLLINRYLLCLI